MVVSEHRLKRMIRIVDMNDAETAISQLYKNQKSF